jgi:ATP-dependent DNA helicase PIF1
MANTDIQPPTTLHALLDYVGKYVSKPEKSSVSYVELQKQILPYTNHRSPLLSFASKLLNKLIAERDWSAQEVSHILLGLTVQESSRMVVSLDCRPENAQDNVIVLEDRSVKAQRSPLKRYQDRLNDAKDITAALRTVTLFEWLQMWNWQTFVLRPRAPPRVINYWPKYAADQALNTYADYCRVKLMLHHPFVDLTDLLSIDGQAYGCFTDAFTACAALHNHPQDYYNDPVNPEPIEESDSDSDTDLEDEQGPLADFEVFSRRRPQNDLSELVDIEALGMRDLDRTYDWSSHINKYDIDLSIWDEVKAVNPIQQHVTVDSSPGSLNPEQRKLYGSVIDHFTEYLETGQESQLLLNVDGVAGSGKTYTLLKICSRLQELAFTAGRENPVFRAAPTGIAAFNIVGKTLHSLLRLPVKSTATELSNASLQSLQAAFQSCRYLIIDEKSMIDLNTLSLIDDRLRAIFPSTDQIFGGLNILLCGDFFQLPPVGGKPLFSTLNLQVNGIKGQQLSQLTPS